MRRNRRELRWLARTGFFLVVTEDFLWEPAGFDCGFVLVVPLGA